ncbi:hypothetical protein GCK72_022963 [Caenorhabditis remanei]|uniref:Uncharacterized protein n=1 Tax=Caenorhabditis remanei TaxID=31234 RepID=A0A6A5FVA4_CAERE|nr:hypothetical protein GCK72_022963 [Caenorhabditis remanei]KAF1746507.1 hypothetical protein GCK72_022963 [Caenorhabditis remanei]
MNNTSEPGRCRLERAAKNTKNTTAIGSDNKLPILRNTSKPGSVKKQNHRKGRKAAANKSSVGQAKVQTVRSMKPKNMINKPSTFTASLTATSTDLSSSSAPRTSTLVSSTIPAASTTCSPELSVSGICEPKPSDDPTSSNSPALTTTYVSTEPRNFFIEQLLAPAVCPPISSFTNVSATSSVATSSVTSSTPYFFNGSFNIENLLTEAKDKADATIMDTSASEDTAEDASDEQDEDETKIDVTSYQSYREYQGLIPFDTDEPSYSWKDVLYEKETENNEFLPIEALPFSLLVHLENRIEEGLLLEIAVPDMICDKNHQVAKIIKVCGFRLLIEYQYTAEQEWIHLFDEKVHSVRINRKQNPPIPTEHNFIEPNLTVSTDEVFDHPQLVKTYEEAKKNWWKSDYSVGQRFELLNFSNPSQIRVARIKAICGRRLSVIVEEKDYPGDFPPPGEEERISDPQLAYKGTRWWVDQDSDFIYPVGFSNLIGYELIATPDYKEHSQRIAEAIRNNRNPEYDESDIKFNRTILREQRPEFYRQVEVGNHMEILNPVAKNFNSLSAAKVFQIYPNLGYMIIKILGGEQKGAKFPIRILSELVYPVGYAKRNHLELDAPKGFANRRKTSIPIRVGLSPNEKVKLFKIGMKLEAASKNENAHICPATIKSLHGQIIKVAFDGWGSDVDELYDVCSHDIFPVGWAEMHGYPVDFPQSG